METEKIPPPSSSRGLSTGGILLLAFVVGGLSGGLFGTVAVRGGLDTWFGGSASNSATVTAQTGTVSVREESATVDIVERVSPAVVSIIAKKDFGRVFGNEQPTSPFDFFFDFPQSNAPQPQGKQEIGGGTGFLVSPDGTILTNKHVAEIEGADEFTVVTNDEKTYDAKVIAVDPGTDIAVMKIEGSGLPTIELGDSDAAQIGDTVIAIGNALGEYRNTVTKGIISGLSRTIRASDGSGNSETLRNVIQTDAAINRGNSGGPLLNLAGQAIGINTAIDSQGQLIGFALPINIAKHDLESVRQTGKIERPYLGIRYVIITAQVKEANQLSVDYGALVVRGETRTDLAVIPGSPADKVGIVENDIVLEIDGQRIDEENDLSQVLFDKSVGQPVTLKVFSKGQEKTFTATLEARP